MKSKKIKLLISVFMIVLLSALPSISNINVNAVSDTLYFEPPITTGFYYIRENNANQILYIKNNNEVSNSNYSTIKLQSADGKTKTFTIATIDGDALDEVNKLKLNASFKSGISDYFNEYYGNGYNIPDYQLDLTNITVYNLDKYLDAKIERNIHFMLVNNKMRVDQYYANEYIPSYNNLLFNIESFAYDMVDNIDNTLVVDARNEGIAIGKNEAFNNYDRLLPNVFGSILMFFTSIFGSINFFGISLLSIIGIIGGILLLLLVLKIVRG